MKQILRFTLVAAAMLCSTLAWADTTVVGAEDNTTEWWTAFSEPIKLEPNKTLTMEFTNYSSKVENWHNFVVVLASTPGHSSDSANLFYYEGYSEYAVVRPDNWGWGDSYNGNNASNNWNWDAFKENMDGAKVSLSVKRDGSDVTVRADVVGSDNNSYFQQYSMTIDATAEMYISLCVEQAHLVIDNSKTAITDTNPEVREEGQIGKTDNTTGFFGEYSAYSVADNETLTLVFTNYAGAANWNNFDVILSNVDSRTDLGYTEYAIIRADNFAWQVWDDKTTAGPDVTWFTSLSSSYNWDTFLADMDGANVVLTIQRKGDQVTVHADITTNANAVYYYDFIMPIAEGESLYALLGVDGSHLVLDESKFTSATTPMGIVGLETCTTPFFTHFSDYFYVAPSKTLNLTFANYSLKQENFQNFCVVLANGERGDSGYEEYAVLRADNFAWNAAANSVEDQSWFTSLESNYNWDTFKDDLDDANVNMKVIRDVDDAAKVKVHADITTNDDGHYFEEFVINCGDGTKDLVVYLTTEKGYLLLSSDSIEDSVSNGITAASAAAGAAVAPVFNLAGQRVAKAVKGVYVQDGKKFVVK